MGAVAAAVVVVGCGGNSHQSSSGRSARESPSSSLPAGSSAALRSIHGRALRAGELQGFRPQGQLTLATNARSWIAGEELTAEQSAAAVAGLQARGFVKGVSERLTSSVPGAEAISTVLQFRTPQGAADEVATQFKQALTHGQSASTVPGIPGARGFGSGTDFNVAFSAGRYYYLVGYSSPPGTTTHAQLIAAARSLYGRVRGTTSPAASSAATSAISRQQAEVIWRRRFDSRYARAVAMQGSETGCEAALDHPGAWTCATEALEPARNDCLKVSALIVDAHNISNDEPQTFEREPPGAPAKCQS